MLATYTLMLTVLAKAHVWWLDCTDGRFDAAPDEPSFGLESSWLIRASRPSYVAAVLLPLAAAAVTRRVAAEKGGAAEKDICGFREPECISGV
jgi:hypothetical protein